MYNVVSSEANNSQSWQLLTVSSTVVCRRELSLPSLIKLAFADFIYERRTMSAMHRHACSSNSPAWTHLLRSYWHSQDRGDTFPLPFPFSLPFFSLPNSSPSTFLHCLRFPSLPTSLYKSSKVWGALQAVSAGPVEPGRKNVFRCILRLN